jgi:hypothetical protein
MARYDEYEQFQVLGSNLRNIQDGFGSFSLLASRIMLEEQLGIEDGQGMALIDPEKWYPLQNNLRAFERIQTEFGDYVLRQMAMAVPKYAKFPPHIKDIYGALLALDVTYHINHAHKGVPMFSPQTGEMLEGIGHYQCTPVPGRKQLLCDCSNPYLCSFDQGLVLAMALRFEPTATLKHENPSHCRSKGAPNCLYSISWSG